MYRKVKKIKEFRYLLLASLSLQELSIVRSCVKRVWRSQQVGESLSSSQLSTLRRGEPGERKKSEPLTWSGRMCLFLEGDQHHIKNPTQFWPIACKNNTTALKRVWIMFQLCTDAKSYQVFLWKECKVNWFRWNKGFKNRVSTRNQFQNKSVTV